MDISDNDYTSKETIYLTDGVPSAQQTSQWNDPCCIGTLPNEILHKILYFLNPYELSKNASLVSRKWLNSATTIKNQRRELFIKGLRSGDMTWKTNNISDQVPSARRALVSAIYGQVMYVFGGSNGPAYYSNELYALNLNSYTWKYIQPHGVLPAPRSSGVLVAHQGQLIMHGGRDWRIPAVKWFKDTHIFDIKHEQWHSVNNDHAPSARDSHSASIVGNMMVTFGGDTGLPSSHRLSDDVWMLNLDTFLWQLCRIDTEKPQPRCDHSQFTIANDRVVIFGGRGRDSAVPFSDMWLLDIKAKNWTRVSIHNTVFEPHRSWCHSPVMTNGHMVVFSYDSRCPFCGNSVIFFPKSPPSEHAVNCSCGRRKSERLLENKTEQLRIPDFHMYVLDCTKLLSSLSCYWLEYQQLAPSLVSRQYFTACAGVDEILIFGGLDEDTLRPIRSNTTIIVRANSAAPC